MNSRMHACDQHALSILMQLRIPCTESSATNVHESSTLTRVIQIKPHRHAQNHVYQVNLGFVKLTISTNHSS